MPYTNKVQMKINSYLKFEEQTKTKKTKEKLHDLRLGKDFLNKNTHAWKQKARSKGNIDKYYNLTLKTLIQETTHKFRGDLFNILAHDLYPENSKTIYQ